MELLIPSSRAKACRNCAKAKAKCYGIVTSTNKCERCTRLNKDCVMQLVLNKRKPLKQTRSAQIAQIEQKLESLTSIVSVNQQLPSTNGVSLLTYDLPGGLSEAPASTTSQEISQPQGTNAMNTSDETLLPRHQQTLDLLGCSRSNLKQYSCAPDHNHATGKDPDELLNIYRNELVAQVPFVPIPSTMTARELQRERPFLYMAVIMAASFEHITYQVDLAREVMRYLIEHLILLGERSIDLLQGIIVSISWFHFHYNSPRQLNNLLGLMSGLVVDLGITRRSGWTAKHDVFANEIASEFLYARPKLGTMDEKRALVGCFYLSSWATSSLSKMDTMRYSPLIKDCYESIAQDGGQKSDVLLVHFVKLQCLIERIRTSGLLDRVALGGSQTLTAPVGMCVKSFWAELKSLKESWPAEIENNVFLLKNYYSAEIILFQICFYMSPVQAEYNPHTLQRLDVFYACLSSTKSYFDIFLKAPSNSLNAVSMISSGQMVQAIAVLSKLSLFEADDWDLNYVRTVVDLSTILSTLLKRTRVKVNKFHKQEFDNAWVEGARKLEMLKTWYDTKLAVEAQTVVSHPTLSGGTEVEARAGDVLSGNHFDLLGDEFWQGIPGDWGFLQ